MANRTKKKTGVAGLIFTWILILLLAAGTFAVIWNHTSTHSKFIANTGIADALAKGFNKGAGRVTKADVATVEGLTVYAYDEVTSQTYGIKPSVSLYMPGYKEAYDAYYADGVTDEEKENLTNPSSLIVNADMDSLDYRDDLQYFTGLKRLFCVNLGDTSDDDMLSVAVEYMPDIEEFASVGYSVENFADVAKLTKLTSLTVEGAKIDDVSPVTALKSLKELDLANNGITDISALSALDADTIENVYLNGNDITDWTPVEHLGDKVTTGLETEEEAAEETEENAEGEEETAEADSEETEDKEETEEAETEKE